MDNETEVGLELRAYRAGDWKAMYALDLICFEPPFRFGQREMRRLAEAPNAICVLAQADAALAGFCIVDIEDRWAYVVTLDVAPERRRRGLATRLMAAVEARVRAGGSTGIGLHVFNANSGAIRFYERIGYERIGMHEDFYGGGLDALIYRKKW